MAKRYNTQKIKSNRNYHFAEISELLGVHLTTVRNWVREGLICMKDKRPYIIIGIHLIEFLEARNEKLKITLGDNQLLCFSCKKPKIPQNATATFYPDTVIQGVLKGRCPDCNTVMNKMVRMDSIRELMPDLKIEYQNGLDTLNDSTAPLLNTHLNKEPQI